MPEISAEKVTYVIAKARELESDEEKRAFDGSKRARRAFVSARRGDCAAARAELAEFIEAMDEEERCELVALAWIGRGVFTREEWESAVAEARKHREPPAVDYLLGNPMLAPHLENALAEFAEGSGGFWRANR